MKKFLKMFEKVFACYIISMGVQLLFSIVTDVPMKLLFTNYNDLTRFAFAMPACLISMFGMSFWFGYKMRVLNVKHFFAAAVILLALLMAVTCFVGNMIYLSGPTDYLAYYIFYDANPALISGKAMFLRYCTYLLAGAFVVLYVPAMLGGMYLGNKRRKTQFDKYRRR